jgi:dCMP deaminase
MAAGFIGALSHPFCQSGKRPANHGLMEPWPRECIHRMNRIGGLKKGSTKMTVEGLEKPYRGGRRISKEDYYLNIATEVAKRGTCLRRNYGAVIVKNDEIISTGYTGAPRGAKNCIDIGYCPRSKLNVPPGERYELCRSVHAEMNALIHVSRREAMGGTMYLMGIEAQTGGPLPDGAEPCRLCKRVIINAGLERVLTKNINGEVITYQVRDWINNEELEYGISL